MSHTWLNESVDVIKTCPIKMSIQELKEAFFALPLYTILNLEEFQQLSREQAESAASNYNRGMAYFFYGINKKAFYIIQVENWMMYIQVVNIPDSKADHIRIEFKKGMVVL